MSVFPVKKSEKIRVLRSQLQKLYSERCEFPALKCTILNRVLSEGIPRGGIVEWLGDAGSGRTTLALWMAQQVCQDEGVLVVVDRQQQLYPPAMAAFGIDLERTIVLYPKSRVDEIWALVQCLRCPSITAVWSQQERLNAREYRCLQLAAEKSGVVGIFSRPIRAQSQPTWANTRLLVTPQVSGVRRRFKIEVVNCWQGVRGNSLTVERDALTGELRECHEPLPLRLASQLARSSTGRRAARA